MLEPGQIDRLFYLQSRGAAQGRIRARKARAICVVVRTAAVPDAVFLFPMTSQLPALTGCPLPSARWSVVAPVWISPAGSFLARIIG